jgi:hypothetical protein
VPSTARLKPGRSAALNTTRDCIIQVPTSTKLEKKIIFFGLNRPEIGEKTALYTTGPTKKDRVTGHPWSVGLVTTSDQSKSPNW